MPFDPESAALRIHSLADAVSASPSDVTTIHDALVAGGFRLPSAGISVDQEARDYAQMVLQVPEFLTGHPEVDAALNSLRNSLNKRPISTEVDWHLVGFILICIVLCFP